jgi:hypothetical protein
MVAAVVAAATVVVVAAEIVAAVAAEIVAAVVVVVAVIATVTATVIAGAGITTKFLAREIPQSGGMVRFGILGRFDRAGV